MMCVPCAEIVFCGSNGARPGMMTMTFYDEDHQPEQKTCQSVFL